VRDHAGAMAHILGFLRSSVSPGIEREVAAVGHRVVHGLDIHRAVLLDGPLLREIERASALAPLHNPPGLQGIHAARSVFKGVPQVSEGARWGGRCREGGGAVQGGGADQGRGGGMGRPAFQWSAASMAVPGGGASGEDRSRQHWGGCG
jgi:hypothetical protein